MTADHRGQCLEPARTLPASADCFTHILKPTLGGGFECLPTVEWAALELAAGVGLEAAPHALVEMPDCLPPALLVERFDIRRDGSDTTFYCLEDFCSVLGVPSEMKYKSTIERAAKAMQAISTNIDDDLRLLFRRGLFAWLIADGDMHLKNLAMVKTAAVGDAAFRSVRMAAVYDAVTTRIFPSFANDRLALKLNGKDDRLDRLDRDDLLSLARTIGLPVAFAKEQIDEMSGKLLIVAGDIPLPVVRGLPPRAGEFLARQREVVASRCRAISA